MKAYYLRPSNEEFEDSYAQAGLQPSTGSRGVIKHATVEYAKNAAGSTVRQQGGNTMMRAGAAMSRTGAGAVVGVPLMAAGAVTKIGATKASVSEAMTDQPGRSTRTISRKIQPALKNAPGIVKNLKDTVKATRTSVLILSWATPLWFTIQLPMALLTLATFGAVGTAAEYLPAWLVEWTAGNVLILLQVVVFFIGLATLIAMGIIYSLSGVKAFFGQGAHIKIPVFCLAVVGYLLPFVNVFPWFILWALVVWRYPK
jgi:hypothetical protein